MRKKIALTLLRMANRLFQAVIGAGLFRVVVGGHVTVAAIVAFVIALVLVVTLLVTAFLITKK